MKIWVSNVSDLNVAQVPPAGDGTCPEIIRNPRRMWVATP